MIPFVAETHVSLKYNLYKYSIVSLKAVFCFRSGIEIIVHEV